MRRDSSAVSGRTTRAGMPSARCPAVTRCPGVTTAPAPTCAPASTTAPSSTRAPMPIRAPSSTVQPCSTAWWPITTPAPTTSGWVRWATCSTAPSCTLVRGPTRIQLTSPRAAVWNQNEASSPTSTSPTSCASGARKTRAPRAGHRPSYASTGIGPLPYRQHRENDALVAGEQALEVGARGRGHEVDAGLALGHLEHQRAARFGAAAAVHPHQHAAYAADLVHLDQRRRPGVVGGVALLDVGHHRVGIEQRDRADAHVDHALVLLRLEGAGRPHEHSRSEEHTSELQSHVN